MNKGDIVAKYGADHIWNNNVDRVVAVVQRDICSKCKPVMCHTPCPTVWNGITNCMWQVLGFYARLN